MAIESKRSLNFNTEGITLKELLLKGKEWWQYLVSKWLIIVCLGLLGGILGFVYANFKKPSYTATTTFVLEDEKGTSGGLGSLAGLASVAGVDLGGSGGGIFQGDNILALYKSRTMIEKTLLTEADFNGKKQLLINRYIEFNELRKIWSERPELKNIEFSGVQISKDLSLNNNLKTRIRLQDSIMGEVVKDINRSYLSATKPDKKLSIIDISVNARDELFAKSFNDAIVRNVNDFYIETKTKKSLLNVSILQHKTDSVRAVMNGSIFTVASVTDATPNLNPTRQIQRLVPIQKAQFSAETNKAVLSELLKNLELSKMNLMKETPLIQVIDKPIYPLKKEKLGKAKGLVFGGLIGGILILIYLFACKIISDTMNPNTEEILE